MNKSSFFKLLSTLIFGLSLLISINSCEKEVPFHNYVDDLKLDLDSNTKKAKVEVLTFIDGDTTHFKISPDEYDGGVIKVRYLAIDTPESTGEVEEYGKAASFFTKEKLEKAEDILIESNDSNWNKDSSGSRILCWVWYKNNDDSEYKNLNLELLQNGYANPSSIYEARYSEYCINALNQAKKFKLNKYSGEKDQYFYYGDSIELTIKEIRLNLDKYDGKKVRFEGVVTNVYNNSFLIEEYDIETDLYYGLSVYLGNNYNGEISSAAKYGNRVRCVGTLQYFSAGGYYQVSGVTYRLAEPDYIDNIKIISTGNSASYKKIDVSSLKEKTNIYFDDYYKEYDYGFLILHTSIEIDNLTCKDVYTTDTIGSASKGAMTLTCYNEDGIKVIIRTIPLMIDFKLIKEDAFLNKTFSVKGFVDIYENEYQVKVFDFQNFIFTE